MLLRFLISAAVVLTVYALLDISFPFEPRIAWSPTVLDRRGRVLNVYISKDDKWRMPCPPEEVDSLLLKTLLKKEDRYFYYHPGFNPFAIARAFWNNLLQTQRTSGASTITMQVVRLLEPRQRNLPNKCIEAFRALQLELHYSKKDILTYYLSLVPYGGNIEGVKAASHIYFGKSPALLSPAEAVLLTIIPNRPSSLRPGKRNSTLLPERNRWLRRLFREGIIRREDLEQALSEPVEMQRRPFPSLAPHFSRRLVSTFGEVEIRSSLDADLQMKVSQLCYNHSKRLQGTGISNAAVLVIDNHKMEVLAYCGSQDYNDHYRSGQVDGIKAIRSPGSTLKPLIYAMAFDQGMITPLSMLADVPVNYQGYSPENFDRKYHGLVSAEDALSASLNIPAVLLLEKAGVDAFRKNLLKAGFASMEKQRHLGLSSILGGCGVSLEELCGLYSAFANNGSYSPIRYIAATKPRRSRFQLISSSAAFILSNTLSKMNRCDLPNLFENSLHIPKVAWKTGTSYGRRDGWCIAYNKKYTVGVWTGNFDGTGVNELTGADMATPLMFQVFNSIDYNGSGSWYRAGKDLDLRYVCPKSGMPPGDLCTEKVIDYFLPGISSNETCRHLIEIYTDAQEQTSYCTSCLPENGYLKRIYDNPPPEILTYYRENGIPVKMPPTHLSSCSRLFEGSKPRITSISDGQEYLIEKDEPRSLELSSVVGSDVNEISWFINDIFYKTVKAGEKIFFTPPEGSVKISCTDNKGRNTNSFIKVLYY